MNETQRGERPRRRRRGPWQRPDAAAPPAPHDTAPAAQQPQPRRLHWRWPLFLIGLLVAAFAASKTVRLPTRIAAQLVAQKVSVEISPAQMPGLPLSESMPIQSVFANFVGVAKITGARLQPQDDTLQESVSTEQSPLEIRCTDANLQPALRLIASETNQSELAALELLPLHANPGEALAVWTDSSNALTLQLRAPAQAKTIAATIAASAPFRAEVENCTAALGGNRYDLSAYTIIPESEGCDISIAANPRMTLVLSGKHGQAPQLLRQGALRVSAVDFSAEHPTRGRQAALLADGELTYPDFPTKAGLTLLRRNGIKFDQLGEFYIEELQLASSTDAAAAASDLRVRLYGTANEIRERRPTGEGRDLRLTVFDMLNHHDWLHDALWIGAGAIGLLASIFTVIPRK